jgi:hypothetical protein
MPALVYEKCHGCGTWHTIHRHAVTMPNSGTLYCPRCGKTLVRWDGDCFFTVALPDDPPALLGLMDAVHADPGLHRSCTD